MPGKEAKMKKLRFLLMLLAVFMLVGISHAEDGKITDSLLEEALKEEEDACNQLKDENDMLLCILDFAGEKFSEEPWAGTEINKLRKMTKEADKLISENRNLLSDIGKDDETISLNLQRIEKNQGKVNFMHKRI